MKTSTFLVILIAIAWALKVAFGVEIAFYATEATTAVALAAFTIKEWRERK